MLIGEIEDIVNRHHYLSFGLITQGIELLGAIIEDPQKEFSERNLSEGRFKKALKRLFPSEYHIHKDLLYTELRCGMSHVLRPRNNIVLAQRQYGHENLSQMDDKLLLVAEDFFDDFKDACNQVIGRLDSGCTKERAGPFLTLIP